MGRKGEKMTPDKKIVVLDLFLKVLSPCKICDTLDIPYSTSYNILQKFKESGTVENKK